MNNLETKEGHEKKTEKVILNALKTVKVDEITGKTIIEYDTQKIILSKITERFEKLGYKVEIVSREEIR